MTGPQGRDLSLSEAEKTAWVRVRRKRELFNLAMGLLGVGGVLLVAFGFLLIGGTWTWQMLLPFATTLAVVVGAIGVLLGVGSPSQNILGILTARFPSTLIPGQGFELTVDTTRVLADVGATRDVLTLALAVPDNLVVGTHEISRLVDDPLVAAPTPQPAPLPGWALSPETLRALDPFILREATAASGTLRLRLSVHTPEEMADAIRMVHWSRMVGPVVAAHQARTPAEQVQHALDLCTDETQRQVILEHTAQYGDAATHRLLAARARTSPSPLLLWYAHRWDTTLLMDLCRTAAGRQRVLALLPMGGNPGPMALPPTLEPAAGLCLAALLEQPPHPRWIDEAPLDPALLEAVATLIRAGRTGLGPLRERLEAAAAERTRSLAGALSLTQQGGLTPAAPGGGLTAIPDDS